MRSFVITVLGFLSCLAGLPAAETNSISMEIHADLVSKYLSRGITAYGHPALQPGLDLKLGGLSLAFWSSIHLGPSGAADPDRELANGNRFCEADVTVSFEQALPFCEAVSLNAGFTYYTFPSTDDQTVEITAGAAWDTFLSPSLAVWHDPALGNGTYIEAGISQDWELGMDWSASLTVGYNYRQWGCDPSFTAVGLSLEPSRSFGPLTIGLILFGQCALDRQYFSRSGSVFDWYAGLSCRYDHGG